MQQNKLSEWKHLAEKELRGEKLESLNVETAEGIDIKPCILRLILKASNT